MHTQFEPIAIIGMSCEFSGLAGNTEDFWKMLMEQKHGMKVWPKDRINLDAFYSKDGSRTFNVRGAYLLDRPLGSFDPRFFALSPKEAHAMDPQQRHLLETAYRAFENAGMPLERISGTATSVYTGCFSDDYKAMLAKGTENPPDYHATGVSMAMLANRLSWFFNVTGPSVNFDSACSSSMMGLDAACRDLRDRTSNMALVAGVNLVMSPDTVQSLSSMGFLSPEGLCFSFDHRANGYAKGEGSVALVLKRVSDAVQDGDVIRAVIRSTACMQDGRTLTITQPSQYAQEVIIRQAYAKSGLNIAETAFVEAHGTGTRVGDPIEAAAIAHTFGDARRPHAPIIVGAVKSNIGHLEGASGLAAVVKVVLSLERGQIPPNTNFECENPAIDLRTSNIVFPTQVVPWPDCGTRRASICNYGFGGSNTHVILEDAYHYLETHHLNGLHATITNSPHMQGHLHKENIAQLMCNPMKSREAILDWHDNRLLVFSAADTEGITRIESLYRSYLANLKLENRSERDFANSLAFTLASKRSKLLWRSYTILRGPVFRHLDLHAPIRAHRAPTLVFVFTGQGAQYPGMGRQLLNNPTFRFSMERSQTYFSSFGVSRCLLAEWLNDKPTSHIDLPQFSQPLTTALQIALVDMLESYGCIPSVVVGHSSGEIAAAYCKGALSHKSACKIAYYRGLHAGRLAEILPYQYSMMAVALSVYDIESMLPQDGSITVSCYNSPNSLTLAGERTILEKLRSTLDTKGIFAKILNVNVPYHSTQMRKISKDFLDSIGHLKGRQETHVQMVSTVSAVTVDSADLRCASYWDRNLVSPVDFVDAIKNTIASTSLDQTRNSLTFVEIGPHSALRDSCQQTLKEEVPKMDFCYVTALRRGSPPWNTVMTLAGELFCRGHQINIEELNHPRLIFRESLAPIVDAPSYSFDNSNIYWAESRLSKEGHRLRKIPSLNLLGTPSIDWNPLEARWRFFINEAKMPWVQDHRIGSNAIYPASGFVAMAIEGLKCLLEDDAECASYLLRHVQFRKPLRIPSLGHESDVQICISSTNTPSRHSGWSRFRIFSFENGQCFEHCAGEVRGDFDHHQKQSGSHKAAIAWPSTQSVDKNVVYSRLALNGYHYGPEFQRLDDVVLPVDLQIAESRASIALFEWVTCPQPHIIHPTTLDAGAQLMLIALQGGSGRSIPTVVPTEIRHMRVSARGNSCTENQYVHAWSKVESQTRQKVLSRTVFSDRTSAEPLVEFEMESSVIAEHVDTPQQMISPQLCYSVSSKPDIDLLSPHRLHALCVTALQPNQVRLDYCRALDSAQLCIMSETLRSLDDHALQHIDSISPLKRHVEWMRRRVDEASQHHSILDRVVHDYGSAEALYQLVEDFNIQGKVYMTLGRELPNILKGKTDPLQIFFQSSLASDYYGSSARESVPMDQLQSYLSLLYHKNPKIRILELGAGTGSETTLILEALTHAGNGRAHCYSMYDYTDISSAFFEDAKEKFKSEAGRFVYRILDIEKDPIEQGFAEHSYDLVVAGSVLHATSNLTRTLRHVHKLLTPGGRLLLGEVTGNDHREQAAFGVLSSWWTGEEEFRAGGPCVPTEVWHDLLKSNGFSGVDLELRDFAEAECHEFSTIFSTSVVTTSAVQQHDDISLIVAGSTTAYWDVAASIQQHLESSLMVPCRVHSLEQAAELQGVKGALSILITDVDRSFLASMDNDTWGKLQQAITRCSQRLLWISANSSLDGNPEQSMLDGFTRVLRTEIGYLKITTLQLEANIAPESQLDVIGQVVGTIINGNDTGMPEPEYQVKGGTVEIRRILPDRELSKDIQTIGKVKDVAMVSFDSMPAMQLRPTHTRGGSLEENLIFEEDNLHNLPLLADEIEVCVEYTGINWRDCMLVLNQHESSTVGGECTGHIARIGADYERDFEIGDRVVVVGPLNTYAKFVRCSRRYVTKIPDSISLSDASAIPIIYITAHYSIAEIARLQHGETILIHLGSGATGQAAIQMALYLGAIVFTTAGSAKKRSFIHERYNIPTERIFSSRDVVFSQEIMRQTGGRGVDVVFNTLSGEGLFASWDCIASFGRFLEIGKKDVMDRKKLPMHNFHRNTSFSVIDLELLMKERPELGMRSLEKVLELMVNEVLAVPEPLTVYRIGELAQAFRKFQTRLNIGKMIVEMRSDDTVQAMLRSTGKCTLDAQYAYVIAGGLGGLGRSTARWMATRGARKIVLLSRTGPVTDEAIALIDDLCSWGVKVQAPKCDISNSSDVKRALQEASSTLGPIRGCIQSTMVIRDNVFENMPWAGWRAGIAPKVQGSWNLHKHLPSDLDFYVLLSSVSGQTGFGGQVSYAAGNTYQDGLAWALASKGKEVMALDLGWMADEGIVAGNTAMEERMARVGCYIPISTAQYHGLLDRYCEPSRNALMRSHVQRIIGLQTPDAMRVRGYDLPSWMHLATFSHIAENTAPLLRDPALQTCSEDVPVGNALQQTKSYSTALAIIMGALVRKLARAIMVDEAHVDVNASLSAHGVDSLLAIEMRNWAAKEVQADVSVMDIMDAESFEVISRRIGEKSAFCNHLFE